MQVQSQLRYFITCIVEKKNPKIKSEKKIFNKKTALIRTQLISSPTEAHSSSSSSSSYSSASDRRINALVRHIVGENSISAMDTISASPTSTSHGNSVFAHLVRAPYSRGTLFISYLFCFCVQLCFFNQYDTPVR